MGLSNISHYPVRLHRYVKDRPLAHTPRQVYITSHHDLSAIRPCGLLLFMLSGQVVFSLIANLFYLFGKCVLFIILKIKRQKLSDLRGVRID